MRLFAFSGGPLALDALIHPLAQSKPPQRNGDLKPWCEEVFGHLIRTKAAAASLTLDFTNKNAMQFIKLALKNRAPAMSREESAKQKDYDLTLVAVGESIRSGGKKTFHECYEEINAKSKTGNGPK
jgi:hypothetical protein